MGYANRSRSELIARINLLEAQLTRKAEQARRAGESKRKWKTAATQAKAAGRREAIEECVRHQAGLVESHHPDVCEICAAIRALGGTGGGS